ncbi:MAG: dihydropteroate synthase, partial [Chitinophagaceae bacterium]|nr:dihydropteroate synthase [Chitinophagaceae bacterium]
MFTLNCKGRLVVVDRPIVMAIINVTPDSFFAGSRHQDADHIVQEAGRMLQEGATILDIGGQSTRPGSERVGEDEELKRVIPAIEAIHIAHPTAIVSIDTYYAKVASEAVAAGASIVNDVSAGRMDVAMVETVASLQVPYILMHMKGTPETMQQAATYSDVTKEVLDFFIHQLPQFRAAGINDIIVDPGFGFAKTIDHNFELLRNLSVFQMLDVPILLGVSRKSTVYKTLGVTAEEALNGSTVLHTIGLLNGAMILRTHDVKEAM